MIDAQLLDSIPLIGKHHWKLAEFLKADFTKVKEPFKICDTSNSVKDMEDRLHENARLIEKFLVLYAEFVAERRHAVATTAISVLLKERTDELKPFGRRLFRRFNKTYRHLKRERDALSASLALLGKKRTTLEEDQRLMKIEARDHDLFGRYQYWQENLGLTQVLIHQVHQHHTLLKAMHPQGYSTFLWKSLGGYYD